MNDFEKQVAGTTSDGLYSLRIETLQVNLGLRCNQQCTHCHLDASPHRRERMEWPIMQLVLEAAKSVLPSSQSALEEDYRRELHQRLGITFTHLLTITNRPLGRFRMQFIRPNQERNYLNLLRKSFNRQTVNGLMCRHQISVGWDGTFYDCDFNLALGLPVNHGAPDHIRSFKPDDLKMRRVVTGEHCFTCTAGSGSSCGGALI